MFNPAVPQALKSAISILPMEGVSLVVAYGSRVIPQGTHSEGKALIESRMQSNMLDLILAVDDPFEWTARNLARNTRHYSSMRFLGAKKLAHFQNLYPHLYCNTKIYLNEDQELKYSVISTSQLYDDLVDWKTLYVSGRLHKPHFEVVQTNKDDLKDALVLNRSSAVHAALLMLPEQFTLEAFFIKLTSLSYDGDFRTYFAEDRNKIAKIVDANFSAFAAIYVPFLNEMSSVDIRGDENDRKCSVVQELSILSLYHHLELLPKHPLENLRDLVNRDGKHRDIEETIWTLAHKRKISQFVEESIRSIVRWSSLWQTLKNFPTAGISKSVRYSFRKLRKGIGSWWS